jgi:hypothetical protein
MLLLTVLKNRRRVRILERIFERVVKGSGANYYTYDFGGRRFDFVRSDIPNIHNMIEAGLLWEQGITISFEPCQVRSSELNSFEDIINRSKNYGRQGMDVGKILPIGNTIDFTFRFHVDEAGRISLKVSRDMYVYEDRRKKGEPRLISCSLCNIVAMSDCTAKVLELYNQKDGVAPMKKFLHVNSKSTLTDVFAFKTKNLLCEPEDFFTTLTQKKYNTPKEIAI